MLELLTNDSVIFLFGAVGLATTAVSILRDARSQRERVTAQNSVRLES
ncbi:MAG TPA: hypothetical protein VI056_02345 [Candidatus Limnocylindria bacterium]